MAIVPATDNSAKYADIGGESTKTVQEKDITEQDDKKARAGKTLRNLNQHHSTQWLTVKDASMHSKQTKERDNRTNPTLLFLPYQALCLRGSLRGKTYLGYYEELY